MPCWGLVYSQITNVYRLDMRLFSFCAAVCIVVLSACADKTESQTDIAVDVFDAKNVDLDDVVDTWEIIPLQDSVLMGEIFQVDMDVNYILLQDMYQNKIHIYDRAGRYINTLDKLGKGPGEYTDASVYTYNADRQQIVVNSGNNGLVLYSVPDCRFIAAIKNYHAYSALISLDSTHLLGVISDYIDNKMTGKLELFDLSTLESQTIDIPFPSLASIVYSESRVFSPAPEPGQVYYCQPYSYSEIYKVGISNVQKVARIEFGAEALPEEDWDTDIVPYFRKSVNTGSVHALAAKFLIRTDSVCSFWYWCSQDKDDAWEPTYYYAHNRITGKELNIRNLCIKDLDIKLIPIGISQGQYIALIESALVDTSVKTDSPITRMIINEAQDRNSPLIVCFKLAV